MERRANATSEMRYCPSDCHLLGWDTDMFPTDPALSTYIMKRVVEMGGLEPGGLNFDAKVRRESSDIEDLFIGHINPTIMSSVAIGTAAFFHVALQRKFSEADCWNLLLRC